MTCAQCSVLSSACIPSRLYFSVSAPLSDLAGPKHCSKFDKSDAGGGGGGEWERLSGSCRERFNFSTVGNIKTFSCLKHDF